MRGQVADHRQGPLPLSLRDLAGWDSFSVEDDPAVFDLLGGWDQLLGVAQDPTLNREVQKSFQGFHALSLGPGMDVEVINKPPAGGSCSTPI
jgi:hypothetical protein